MKDHTIVENRMEVFGGHVHYVPRDTPPGMSADTLRELERLEQREEDSLNVYQRRRLAHLREQREASQGRVVG